MTHPNHERGGVLLYAVIAVAFLSVIGLKYLWIRHFL